MSYVHVQGLQFSVSMSADPSFRRSHLYLNACLQSLKDHGNDDPTNKRVIAGQGGTETLTKTKLRIYGSQMLAPEVPQA